MEGALGSLDSLRGVPLHLALDNTGVGLVACDATGRLTLISPVLQALFEMDRFEPITEPLFVSRFGLFRTDGVTPLPVEEVPLYRARRGEFVRDAVLTTRKSDDSLVHVKCNAVPLRDEAGADNGAIALVQDVTAEVEASRRTEALRQRLVASINHEFRTPLAALLGHVELIRDHRDQLEEQDPELARWLAAIERSGWKLRDLVQEVSELVTREEDGGRPVDCRPRPMRSA